MNQRQLAISLWVRYVNVLMIWFFLSSIPMPVNRFALAACSVAALFCNICLHLYAKLSGRFRRATYLILVVDLLTIVPAIYFTGFVGSPFWVVLPLALNTVYFVNFNLRASRAYGIGCVFLIVGLFLVWWYGSSDVPGWNPREYPFFTVSLFVGQLVAIMAVIHQTEFLPRPLMVELQKQEATMMHQRHQIELGASLSVVSHEIRNPLTTIALCVGQIGVLLEPWRGAGKAQVQKYLKSCEEDLCRATAMLDSILSYARAGKDKYHFESNPVSGLIARAVDLMKLKYGRYSIGFNMGPGVDDGWSLRCDRDAMHHVLVNLLDNAVQNRSVDRPLEIEFRVLHEKDRLVLTIRDNGVGIAPKKLPHIFERFTSDRSDGTGLGLFVVRQIVEDHGGSVEAQSVVGVGTTFIISMPIDSAEMVDASSVAK